MAEEKKIENAVYEYIFLEIFCFLDCIIIGFFEYLCF